MMKLSDVNHNTGYGRLLLAALTYLSVEKFSDKTPDEILEILDEKATEMYGKLQPSGDSPGPFGLLHLGRGTFGQAIEALKQGHIVARSGWNGKGMFIFMRPADELQIDFIINNVKSLPQSVKNFFKQKDEQEHPAEQGLEKVKFTQYLCMYAADGSIVNGWLASQTDMLAEDWTILE